MRACVRSFVRSAHVPVLCMEVVTAATPAGAGAGAGAAGAGAGAAAGAGAGAAA